jgi:dienelactone hydrolase
LQCNLRGGFIHRKLRKWTFCQRAPILFSPRQETGSALGKPLVVVDDVTTVEVRIPANDVVARIDEVRRWLSAQRIQPLRVISTGNSGEMVVLCEFNLSGEAEKFALEFSGTLV